MKASDSVNSLTHLQDTGCIVCSESAGEKGEALVESKHLTKCGCQYMVHLSCWNGSRTCLSCGKHVIPHLVRVLQESGASAGSEDEATSESVVAISRRSLYIIAFVSLCCIAFIIYLIISFR